MALAVSLLIGDVQDRLREIPDESIDACICSPPYFNLRRYLPDDDPNKALEIGAEATPEEYIAGLVEVFRGVRRVLKATGTLWVNLGDAHARTPSKGRKYEGAQIGRYHKEAIAPGYKPKDLYGLPFMLAFALRADGWIWQSCSPWIKRNPMPESIRDRPCHAVEYILQFAKTERPWADMHSVLVPYARREGSGNGFVRPERLTAANPDGTPRGADAPWVPNHNGRHRRDSDPFMESLQTLADGGEGLLAERGEPLAFVVNPRPYKGAHYAAYPLELVVPILRFACPPRVCAACGAPWVRVVERKQPPRQEAPSPREQDGGLTVTQGMDRTGRSHFKEDGRRKANPPVSRGWKAACGCPDGTPILPGIVLDPFIGSGTTAQAAVQEGRRWVGIDLDPRNEVLVRERVAKARRSSGPRVDESNWSKEKEPDDGRRTEEREPGSPVDPRPLDRTGVGRVGVADPALDPDARGGAGVLRGDPGRMDEPPDRDVALPSRKPEGRPGQQPPQEGEPDPVRPGHAEVGGDGVGCGVGIGPVAQPVEQGTLNPLVGGSTPPGLTTFPYQRQRPAQLSLFDLTGR